MTLAGAGLWVCLCPCHVMCAALLSPRSMGKAEDLEELHALSQRVAGVVMKVHGVGQMMAQADAKGDTLLLRKHTNEMVLEMLGEKLHG